MYQGAKTSSTPPKKRRRRTKKKNPTPLTWVVIAGGTAAVVGGGIATALYLRKKKRAKLLPGNGEPPTNGKRPGTGKAPGKKVNAPEPPFSTSEAKQVEVGWATAVVAEAMPADGSQIPLSKIDSLTDKAYAEMYGPMKIPAKSKRGSGWKFYIDSWLRIRDMVRDQVEGWNAGVSGA